MVRGADMVQPFALGEHSKQARWLLIWPIRLPVANVRHRACELVSGQALCYVDAHFCMLAVANWLQFGSVLLHATLDIVPELVLALCHFERLQSIPIVSTVICQHTRNGGCRTVQI